MLQENSGSRKNTLQLLSDMRYSRIQKMPFSCFQKTYNSAFKELLPGKLRTSEHALELFDDGEDLGVVAILRHGPHAVLGDVLDRGHHLQKIGR